jgi:DNA-binding MarR family transcriptional regulator
MNAREMQSIAPPDFVRELLAVALAARKRVRRGLVERGHDLHPSHTSVVPNLPEGGLRLGELAQRLRVSVQRAGQLVQELQTAGYVELKADASDGRAKRVRYSARGRRLIRDGHEINAELWQELASRLGQQELGRFASTLGRLHELLGGRERALLLEPGLPEPRRRKRLRRARA